MADAARGVSNAWFAGLRRQPTAKFQLFCFPFAGGGASAYLRWRDLLSPGVEVWALQYPGHESRLREPRIADAIELATLIAEQIAAAADRPFALFGHSMGALLAFETTRILKRDHGLQPAMLFVSGYSAPHLPPHRRPVRDLPEPAFRDELRLYGGTPAEILADEGMMAFLSPILRCDLGLCELYRHVNGGASAPPIVAFGGYDDPMAPWHRLLAWSTLTVDGFVAYMMPGGHFYLSGWLPRITKMIAHHLECGLDTRPAMPALEEVHLWIAPIDQPRQAVETLRRQLHPEELRRADAYLREGDRARSVIARGVLRSLLERYVGSPAASFVFTASGAGKPICETIRPLEFNVSHSGEMVLIGLAAHQAIGIDVEQVREGIYTTSLAEQVATMNELRQLAAVDADEKVLAFFDLWVRKEACLKRTGRGFGDTPKNLEVGLSRNAPAPGRGLPVADERLRSFTLASNYAGAVAAERPIELATIRVWAPPEDPSVRHWRPD